MVLNVSILTSAKSSAFLRLWFWLWTTSCIAKRFTLSLASAQHSTWHGTFRCRDIVRWVFGYSRKCACQFWHYWTFLPNAECELSADCQEQLFGGILSGFWVDVYHSNVFWAISVDSYCGLDVAVRVRDRDESRASSGRKSSMVWSNSTIFMWMLLGILLLFRPRSIISLKRSQ